MGVKNNVRLVLLLVCLILIGVTVYPHIPALIKTAQAVQGELKFGSTIDQVITVINRTYYSADVFFGNAAGGTVGVLKGTGNVGIGTITPAERLDVWGNITARTTGVAAGNPIMKTGFLGNAGGYLDILADNVVRVHLSSWSGAGNSYIYPLGGGNLGIGTTSPTKTLDVVGDINFSGGLYQAGVAYQGSQWTTASPNIYYNTGNVGIGISSPQTKLDIDTGSLRAAGWSYYTTTRSLGPNAGDWIEIGRIAANGKFTKTNITIVEHNTNNLYIQEYEAYGASHSTPDGASWVALPPKGGRSWYALQNVAVDATKDGTAWEQPTRLRLRRISSAAPSGAGSVTVYLDTMSTFTELSSSGTGATVLNGFFGEAGWMFPVTDAPFKASTEGLFVQQSGNVGIGTTNPQKKLDIVAANSTINNTSGNLSIVPSANLLITQGNVGIGTAAPGSKLSVAGSSAAINSGGYILHAGGTDSNIDPNRYMLGFSHGNNLIDSNVRAGIGMMVTAGGAGNLIFETGSGGAQSERMRINGSGNVGIGTTDPAGYKLNVNGAIKTLGSDIFAQSDNANTAYNYAPIQIREAQYGATSGYLPPRLSFHWGGVVASQIAIESDGTLAIRNNPGTGYEKFKTAMITDNGTNVGIGTTGPSQKLELYGANVADVRIHLKHLNVAGNTNYEGQVYQSANNLTIRSIGDTGTLDAGNRTGAILFKTNNRTGSATTEYDAMYIGATGNVGIGTTSPAGPLQVVTSNAGLSADVTEMTFPHFISWTSAGAQTPSGSGMSDADSTSFGWHSSPHTLGGGPEYGGIDFGAGNAKIITNLRLEGHSNPFKDFEFQGSNDTTTGLNGTWTTLHTAVYMSRVDHVFEEFNFTNSVAFRWYRIKILTAYVSGWAMFSWEMKGPTGGSAFLVTNSGNVGIGTTSPQAKLEVNGDFIRTITKITVPGDDGGDNNQLAGYSYVFNKKAADTAIRFIWFDNFRTNGANVSCRWEIRIDGASCGNPGTLAFDNYHGASDNDHRGGTFVGICNGIAAGNHTITGWVLPSPGYGGSDCYTGWNEIGYMESQEIR